MFRLILRLLRGPWFLLALAGVLTFSVGTLGYRAGVSSEARNTYRVQAAFDSYKLEVLQSVNAANSETQIVLENLQGALKGMLENQKRIRRESRQASDNLVMELKSYEGTSCPVSDGVMRYLDGVRSQQSAPAR